MEYSHKDFTRSFDANNAMLFMELNVRYADWFTWEKPTCILSKSLRQTFKKGGACLYNLYFLEKI